MIFTGVVFTPFGVARLDRSTCLILNRQAWCQTGADQYAPSCTTTLNVTWVEASRVLAQKVMEEKEALDERLQKAFRLITAGRPYPSISKFLEIFMRATEVLENPNEARQLLSVGESKGTSSFLWLNMPLTTTCLGILNLDQALSRE